MIMGISQALWFSNYILTYSLKVIKPNYNESEVN